MAAIIAFQPTQSVPPFQFQATLDGAAYNVILTWLFSGNRWYVNVYDQGNNWIFTRALVGSPADYNISLTAGYFTTALVYRAATRNFEVG